MAEQELQETKEQFRTLAEGAPDAIFIQTNARFAYVNQACRQLLGAAAPSDIVGRPIMDCFHPYDHEQIQDRVRQVDEERKPAANVIKMLITFDDEAIPVEIATAPFSFKGDHGSLVFARDVRDRLEAEANLEENEKRFRRAVEEAPFPAMIHAEDGRILTLSRAGREITGYTDDDIPSITEWTSLAHGERSGAIRAVIADSFTLSGGKSEGAYEILCRDGSRRIWNLKITPLHQLPDGRRLAMIMAADITEIRQAQERMGYLNNVLRSIRALNQLIVHERDPEALIRKGCRLLVDNQGYASAVVILTDEKSRPKTWVGTGMAESAKTLEGMLRSGSLPSCCNHAPHQPEVLVLGDNRDICDQCPIAEETHCTEIQSLCTVLVQEEVSYGYLVAALDRDVPVDEEELSLFTELAGDLAYALSILQLDENHKASEQTRISLEQQLFQAQKMESIGRLAGGVAHDYNNMHGVIIGFAELALEKVDPNEPLREDIGEIMTAANRSVNITRQLLAFARQQTIAPKVLDPNDTVENDLGLKVRAILDSK